MRSSSTLAPDLVERQTATNRRNCPSELKVSLQGEGVEFRPHRVNQAALTRFRAAASWCPTACSSSIKHAHLTISDKATSLDESDGAFMGLV